MKIEVVTKASKIRTKEKELKFWIIEILKNHFIFFDFSIYNGSRWRYFASKRKAALRFSGATRFA
jgi:hypothetical protein